MKRFPVIFLALVLILSFAACSTGTAPKEAAGKSGETVGKGAAEEAADNDGAGETALQSHPDALAKIINADRTKWPKELLHPDMPEYEKGKINGWAPWGPDSADNIFILIGNTRPEDLEEYRSRMEAAGFTPGKNDGYHKDLYDVEFRMNSDNILQISSYKTVPEEWPRALSDIPPINAGNLTSIDTNEDSPDSIGLYYINLPEEKLDTWGQELAKKGFTVDNGSITAENKDFNGKAYARAHIWYEENGSNEWFVYFEFEN